MSKIGIITPSYIDTPEKSLWLNECVESVLSQSLTDWEMIIVNDDSPIGIPDWDDPRIKVVKCPTRTYSPMCRNTGVALTESESILPLDADDKFCHNNVLSQMYTEWEKDRSKVIYGNMVIYDRVGQSDSFSEGKKIEFPEYKFDYTLDLRGIIPVTALHSKNCHIASGGWKKELNHGLEDVEYWVSTGKAGFCGQKIDADVFFYRKHGGSRTNEMRNNGQESAMRNKIREIHNDVFGGKYPMGCCGGSARNSTGDISERRVAQMGTDLSAYADNEKIWVTYLGRRQGSWGVVGRGTGISYTIHGQGFEFQAHIDDARLFRGLGRGKDFRVGAQVKVVDIPKLQEYQPPQPELATIERLPSQNGKQNVKQTDELVFDLSKLGLNQSITNVLTEESWTIQDLANCDISDLMPYPGIGKITANSIKKQAQEWLEAIT